MVCVGYEVTASVETDVRLGAGQLYGGFCGGHLG
jgi:hypothetical protein